MEIVDKFDNKRTFLNKTSDRHEKIEGEYRQSVHTWILNSKGEFLIQKRSANKSNHPNMWSQTGGAVDTTELPIDASLRECYEELGIKLYKKDAELILSFKRKFDFIDVFLIRTDLDISNLKLQEEEVQEVKWVNKKELEQMLENKLLVPSISLYFDMFIKLIDYKD